MRKLRFYCYIAVLYMCGEVCCIPTGQAQSAKLDSLWLHYQTAADDSSRLKLLNEISWTYIWIDPDEAMCYAHEMLRIAGETGIHSEDAAALNYLGVGYYIKGDNERALESYRRAAEKAAILNDSVTIAAVINNEALLYAKLDMYEKAFLNFKQGAAIAKKINNERDYSMALCNTGSMLEKMGEYEQAAAHYRESAAIALRIKYNTAGIALAYLGRVSDKLGKADSSMYYYEEALKVSRSMDDQLGLANIYLGLAELHQRQESPLLALGFLDQAHDLAYRLNYQELLGKIRYTRAQLLRSARQYKQAIEICEQAIAAQKSGQKDNLLHAFYQILSESHAGLGNFERAYGYQQLYQGLRDSLYDVEKHKAIKNIETKFQIEQKEVENQLLREQQHRNEIKIEQRNGQITAAAVIIFLALIIAFIAYQNYLRKKSDSEALEQMVAQRTDALLESNNNLERFAHIASHDLKEPLRNITSFVQLLAKKLEKMKVSDPDISVYLTFIQTGTRQMKTLIDDVLAFTTLNKENITHEATNLTELLESVTTSLGQIIQESRAVITTGDLPVIHSVPALLFVVFKNLIENGIKYNTSATPQVHISYETASEYHIISVQDNGIGIEPVYQDQVFELFARLHDRSQYEGSGLGLSICEKIVQQLGGRMWVESDGVNGSTFRVSLPVSPVAS